MKLFNSLLALLFALHSVTANASTYYFHNDQLGRPQVLTNLNSLAFYDKNRIVSDPSVLEKYPDVVMLSSWNQDESHYDYMKPLVNKLLELGCKYFVCAGVLSESLHDFIDDVIVERSVDDESDEGIEIVTTWHNTDSEEEVAEFFLCLTNVHVSFLMAILEDGRPEDIKLKDALLKLI